MEATSGAAERAAALLALWQSVLPVWQRHLDTARDHAEVAVADMLAAFTALQPALTAAPARAPATDGPPISHQVERMLVGLQYQDRISQMMALLADDMQHMQHALAAPGDALLTLSTKDWMARLEAGYAMAAQRHAHHALQDDPGPAGAPGPTEPESF